MRSLYAIETNDLVPFRSSINQAAVATFKQPSKHSSHMSHTNSKTWVAPKAAEKERWESVSVNLERMMLIPRSPFVPQTFSAWLAHRAGWLQHQAEKESVVAANLKAEQKANFKAGIVSGIGPAFSGRTFNWNRGAVLSQMTMWSHWYQPPEEHPCAPWPSMEEMKEEGDERFTSGYKRFPALPRVPGNETVVWKQKAMIEPYPMDRVWEVPTAESIVTPCLDKTAAELLGQDLLDAMGHEDLPGQQHYDTQTKLGDEEDSDDSATLTASTKDGYSGSFDLGLNQNMFSDIKLEQSCQGDISPIEFAPCDTPMRAIRIREQLRSQLKLKFTPEELYVSQHMIDSVHCNPFQSVENSWTIAWA